MGAKQAQIVCFFTAFLLHCAQWGLSCLPAYSAFEAALFAIIRIKHHRISSHLLEKIDKLKLGLISSQPLKHITVIF